jgi:putative flippase GtrA
VRPIRFTLVAIGSNIIYWTTLYLLTEKAGVWYMASACTGGFLAFCWNYMMQNYWTFRSKSLI